MSEMMKQSYELQQYMSAVEMAEIQKLLEFLNSLEKVSPEGFKVFDSNGEEMGTISCFDAGAWGFYYPEPPREVS